MGFVHGKDTYVSLDGDDLSTFTNSTTHNRSADTHDVTTYGKGAHVFQGGLKNGTATIGGIYDNTAVTGPRAVIRPLLGTTVEFVFRPEGTGSGKPQDTVDVVVNAYNESSPVADMVQWTAELQFSDDVASVAQGA
jgi:hypothetical protein